MHGGRKSIEVVQIMGWAGRWGPTLGVGGCYWATCETRRAKFGSLWAHRALSTDGLWFNTWFRRSPLDWIWLTVDHAVVTWRGVLQVYPLILLNCFFSMFLYYWARAQLLILLFACIYLYSSEIILMFFLLFYYRVFENWNF